MNVDIWLKGRLLKWIFLIRTLFEMTYVLVECALLWSSWNNTFLLLIVVRLFLLERSLFLTVLHCLILLPWLVASFSHSLLSLSLFSGTSHSLDVIHNTPLIDRVSLLSPCLLLTEVGLEGKLFLLFLKFDLFSR